MRTILLTLSLVVSTFSSYNLIVLHRPQLRAPYVPEPYGQKTSPIDSFDYTDFRSIPKGQTLGVGADGKVGRLIDGVVYRCALRSPLQAKIDALLKPTQSPVTISKKANYVECIQ